MKTMPSGADRVVAGAAKPASETKSSDAANAKTRIMSSV
jgi:hypothetical protein